MLSRRTFSFEFSSDDDVIYDLKNYVRAQIRGQEKDSAVLHDYCTRIVKWFTEGKKDGLYIVGEIGCGKTTLLNATCKLMSDLYYTNVTGTGDPMKDRHGFQWDKAERVASWAQNDTARYDEFMQAEWIAIDDIGREEANVMSYGNKLHPIADLLDYRYEMRLITIITTNIMPSNIKDVYGPRVADRLAEMMDILHVKETTYRR